MRAVILAAGEGKRLRPLTDSRPKHMIPVAGRPLIQHIIEALRDNGVHKLTIVLGYQRETIERYLFDGKDLGVEIDYVYQPRPQGTADAVMQLQNRLEEPRFLLLHGDIYVTPNAVREVVKVFDDTSFDAVVAVVKVKDQGRYGLVTIEDDSVKCIIEKPEVKSAGGAANAGLYIFERSIFNAVKKTSMSPRGELELTDSITHLVRQGLKAKAVLIDKEGWIDVGRPWDLLEANEKALAILQPKVDGEVENTATLIGPVTVGSGAKILSGSRVEGPTYIGERSIIGPNCHIRPYTSIGQDVRVGNGCEVKSCIIMSHTKIPHQSYFGDSIIGERCNFGAGTITGNLRLDRKTIRMRIKGETIDSGRTKLGAIIGDDISTGVNVNFMPGVKVGSATFIGPGVTVHKDIPPKAEILMRQTIVRKRRRNQVKKVKEIG